MAAPALLVAPRMPAPAIATPATSAVDMIAGDVSTPPTPGGKPAGRMIR